MLQECIRTSEASTRRIAEELDVTVTGYRVLEYLVATGAHTPGEIARRLGMSPAAITTAVDRLAHAGHVTRTRHPRDRRSTHIIPTPATAHRVAARITPLITELNGLFHGFTTAGQHAITTYLADAAHIMNGQTATPPPPSAPKGSKPSGSG